jgi:hypothetical protein
MKWQGLKTLPPPYPPFKPVWTIQTFNLLSQDIRLLAQDIPDASANG